MYYFSTVSFFFFAVIIRQEVHIMTAVTGRTVNLTVLSTSVFVGSIALTRSQWHSNGGRDEWLKTSGS